MNAFLQTWLRLPRTLVAGVLGLLLVGGLLAARPGKAHGAVSDQPAAASVPSWPARPAASQPVVFAAWYTNVLGDRTRMIQAAMIFMIIGIAFLMWGKDK